MRKTIIGAAAESATRQLDSNEWLQIEDLASVEVTSEDPDYPIEGVFAGNRKWKAATAGPQTVRLIFAEPQNIRKIRLEFSEKEIERSQEFVLGYSQEENGPIQELMRQQWTFSPQGSTSETEEYTVDLQRTVVLQLKIDPDRGKGHAAATLQRWLIA